jgi:Sulfatase
MFPDKFKKLIKLPLFLYLLPIFFVLHGFTESYFLIPVSDSVLLLAKYLFAALVLHFIFFFLFRKKNYRASLFLFVLQVIYFFFGAFHDTLKLLLPGTFFSKYIFVLPFIFLTAIISIIVIRRKEIFTRLTIYLNSLFLILIFIEIFILSGKISVYDKQHQLKSINGEFTLCDTCNKPDIYLIVADEYAGEKTLRDLYNFDNTAFLNQLKERKFQVIKNSISNYNITPISIASLLNINYTRYEGKDLSDISMRPIYNLIDTNILVPFFRFQGYEFINNSIFTVYGLPPLATQPFTPVNTRIIESQTLINRLMRDLGYHLIEWNVLKRSKGDDYTVMHNNTEITKNIKEQVLYKTKKPRFSYSHLTMPHFPYYYNSHGQLYPASAVVEGTQWREKQYLEYLQYTNKVLIDLLDFILQHSRKPPVIILISDHGFRHYSKKVHEEYDFYNLNATFLPDQYVHKFPENMSNISYLRDLLNLLFNQHLTINKQNKYFIPLPKSPDINGE